MADMGRDTKTYPICNPYHGEEGPMWTRFFKPDLRWGATRARALGAKATWECLGPSL